MKKSIIFIIALLPLLHGCLDIKLDNQFSDPDAISNTNTARELLASAYSAFPRFQIELSIMGDDFVPTRLSSRSSNYLNIYNWQEKELQDFSSQVWNDYYIVVAYVNALLQRTGGIEPEDDTDALELAKIEGEAKALKAMCYFDLIRLYAPVWSEANKGRDAIILKDRLELDFLPRATLEASVAAVDRLLGEAASADNSGAPVFYLGSEAVAALRVELELYRGNYGKVVEYGLPLLTNLESKLTSTDYANLWTDNASAERIFAPHICETFYTDLCYDRTQGDYFRLADAVSYSDTDVRRQWCEYQGPMAGVRSLGKYNRMYYDNTEVRYVNTLRYCGVCFSVAEGYARDSRPKDAVALMNRYLAARGADLLDESLSGDALVQAILGEKQKEFVGEGTRFFDLKRLGAGTVRRDNNGAVKAIISAEDYRWLLPIPSSEYRYNDNIGEANQNPGWPYEKAD